MNMKKSQTRNWLVNLQNNLCLRTLWNGWKQETSRLREFSGRKILCAIFVANDSIGEFTCYVTWSLFLQNDIDRYYCEWMFSRYDCFISLRNVRDAYRLINVKKSSRWCSWKSFGEIYTIIRCIRENHLLQIISVCVAWMKKKWLIYLCVSGVILGIIMIY